MPAGFDVCLIVPPGCDDVESIASAVTFHDPDVHIHAVWAGDLQRRPLLPGTVRWADLELGEPTGVGWGRLLTALPTEAFGWARAGRSGARILRSGSRRVVFLRVGAAAVVGSLGTWAAIEGITAIARTRSPLPNDGLMPLDVDLAKRGRWSTAALGVAADAVGMLDDLAEMTTQAGVSDAVGALLDLALARSDASVSAPDSGIAVGWAASTGALSVLDLDDVDRTEPWHVQFAGRRPRQLLSEDLRLADAVASTLEQWRCGVAPVVVPGGIEIDVTIRTAARAAIEAWRSGEGDLPPDPYGAVGLVGWLESGSPRSGGSIGRYWFEEWARRPDLHAVFPDPTGTDRDRFLAWAHNSWSSDGRSPLIRARADGHRRGLDRRRPQTRHQRDRVHRFRLRSR